MIISDTGGVASLTGATIYVGRYTGSGLATSQTSPMSLTFPFVPAIVWIFSCTLISNGASGSSLSSAYNDDPGLWSPVVDMGSVTTSYSTIQALRLGSAFSYIKKSSDSKTIYWYYSDTTTSSNPRYSFNASEYIYHYMAIG